MRTLVVSSGKSDSTSAISLPRSPQPTYTMHCVLEYLESACEMQVLPQPKAPGMAQVPPSTEGKRTSSTRWPVMSASRPGSFSATGRGLRTGHLCAMVTSTSSPVSSCRTCSSGSWMVYSS